MVLDITSITGKYIRELEQKKFLRVVKLNDATSAITQAVDDVARVAEKDIIDAVEPLKRKIAQKDEFITRQKSTSQLLQNENDKLQNANSLLQTELEESKSTTQNLHVENGKLQLEINNQKDANRALQEQTNKLNDNNSLLKTTLEKYKGIVKEAYKQEITPEIREQKNVIGNILTSLLHHQEKELKAKEVAVKSEPVVQKTAKKSIPPKTTLSAEEEKIVSKIIEARKKQVLDKERMGLASSLIKDLFGDVSPSNFDGFWSRCKELVKTDFRDVLTAHPEISLDSVGKRVGEDDIFLRFRSKQSKTLLLSLEMHSNNKSLYFGVYDKNSKLMVATSVENGVIDRLNVRFPDIKIIPEALLTSKQIGNYAQSLTNKKHINISFIKNKANEIFEIVKEYKDKSKLETSFLTKFPYDKKYRRQTMSFNNKGVAKVAYVKTDYGLPSYPLTKSFSFYNMRKQNFKPWDFSLLNDYIK